MKDFPLEIIFEIFSKLSLHDLLSCTLVCSPWRIEADKVLYNIGFKAELPDDILRELQLNCDTVKPGKEIHPYEQKGNIRGKDEPSIQTSREFLANYPMESWNSSPTKISPKTPPGPLKLSSPTPPSSAFPILLLISNHRNNTQTKNTRPRIIIPSTSSIHMTVVSTLNTRRAGPLSTLRSPSPCTSAFARQRMACDTTQ
ncbi:hypothetical protein BC937DRAFT_93918 [Endogone sp. FLAS-F59071]|nr:hypothetical protein BC937DRAFT_93918 [Endogone sp. FLAS-F59071]|eukprot:RUS14377.1 hypothetical protein BC937DRAFT_93918 [Endogone sp. FLAS-F59071]